MWLLIRYKKCDDHKHDINVCDFGLQVVRAIREAATAGELEARKQALVATQVFAAKASPVLAPHFADLAPVLLDCASDPSREVRPTLMFEACRVFRCLRPDTTMLAG